MKRCGMATASAWLPRGPIPEHSTPQPSRRTTKTFQMPWYRPQRRSKQTTYSSGTQITSQPFAWLDRTGLAESGSLNAELKPHPLQTAFAEQGASQCGYCSPGMLMTAKAFLDKNSKSDSKKPIDRQEIRNALSGNLCRCTGYSKIIEAVEQAAS